MSQSAGGSQRPGTILYNDRGPAAEFTVAGLRAEVVEDDLGIHSLMGELLRHWGSAWVDLVTDRSDAAARYQRDTRDLVMMGVEMPGMGGLEATRTIQELELQTSIFLLARVPPNALEEGRVRAVVSKPFRLDQFKMAIREAPDHRESGAGRREGAVA